MAKMNNKGLGMGLEALMKMNVKDDIRQNDNATINEKEILAGFAEISLDKIVPNIDQPRKTFDETSLDELAVSIKNFGLLQPISVVKRGSSYEIIAGERRYRAAKKAGLQKIPVIIKNISQKEKLELSLVENIQRENLNAIEEALAYSSLIDTYNITQEELSNVLGKSRTSITNSIRLLNLDVQIRKWVMENRITPGHARAILSVEKQKEHIAFADYIIKNNLSVRESEILSKKWPIQKKEKKQQMQEAEIKNAVDLLQRKLQTKVKISGNSRKGKISIDYFTQDDLERIIEIMGVKL